MAATATNGQLRDQLKGVRDKIGEERGEKASALKERDEAKDKLAGADLSDPDVIASDDFKAAEQAVAKVGKISDRLADLELSERTILEMLPDGAPIPADPSSPNAGHGGLDAIFGGEGYAKVKAGAQSRAPLGSVSLGEWKSREQTAATLLSGFRAESEAEEALVVGSDEKTGAIPADRRGIVPPQLKPLSLLDLIPAGTTDSNNVEYVQVQNVANEMAEEVADGAAKKRLGLETVDETAPVRTIAGYIKVKKPALEDTAGLQSMIGSLLPYFVRRRLESQILSGTGEGEFLKGLLKTTGIGAPEFQKGDNAADAILRAITTIVLADGDPNFVALHPTAWQDLLLMRWTEKAIEGGREVEGGYIYGSPASMAAPTIWGLSITKNRVVPEAAPLVGDSMACQILVRSGLQLLVSDNDGDDFTRNRATVLSEMRVAFPVWRPASFAKAALS